jgi:chromosomal replication initiator protein
LEAAKTVWERVLGQLQLQVSRANYSTWLANSHGVRYNEGVFVVAVPNTFVAEWLKKRLYSLLKKTLSEIIGLDVEVQFNISGSAHDSNSPPYMVSQHDGGTSTKARTYQFSPQYTFDSFVVGDCNRLAYAATMEITINPGHVYNPLFLYGATGQGKTHLLHAIGHKALNNGLQVIYTTGERFTNDFVFAIKQKNISSFQSKFNTVRVLLFDDIQFISGKKQTQQSLLNIFDTLYSANCQFVITADCHPEEIDALNSKLKSRLEWGPIFPVQPPGFETRFSILRIKSTEMNLVIGDEVLRLLADRIQDNARRLEGALIYLSAQSKLTGIEITPQTVNNMLTNTTLNKRSTQVLLQTVSNYFNLLPEELTSKARDRKTSLARHIAMYLLREDYGNLLTEIGKHLGNRSHATVLHGYRQIANSISSNTQLLKQVEDIRNQIKKSIS